MLKITSNYATNFGGGSIHLPKNALYMRQDGNEKGVAPRFVWLDDMRKAARDVFPLRCYNTATGEVYTIQGRAGSGIGRQFAEYVRKLDVIPRPDYGCSHRDALACGAPRDARPAVFDAKRARPEPAHRMTDKDAVDGVRKGPRWYSVEGYWATL